MMSTRTYLGKEMDRWVWYWNDTEV